MTIDASALVHPTAVLEEGAVLGPGVRVGPGAIVGGQVTLAAGVEVMGHAVVKGRTTIGEGSTIYHFAVVGEVPQDLKYRGEQTALEIGARTRIREHATLNIGTDGGGGVTRVGDDCLIMAGAHVAHDCQVGNRVVMVNNAALAGHCVVGDDVIFGGLSGAHQWVRVGRGAIIGALTMVPHDVIPFGLVQAQRGRLSGLNLVGLKRRGTPRDEINALRLAYQELASGPGAFVDRARKLGQETQSDHVREIVEFVTAASDRSFLTPE